MPSRAPRLAAATLALALGLAACATDDAAEDATAPAATSGDAAPSAGDATTPDGGATATEAPSGPTTPTGEAEPTATSAAPEVTAILPDGSTIALADYAGQTVFVETFATWCTTCRAQLGDTQEAAAQAGDDAVFLALSVESGIDPAVLADYQAQYGFGDITFAVLEPASLAVLEQLYGGAVLVPPSTPKFVVAADGTPSDLTVGFESVDEILAQL